MWGERGRKGSREEKTDHEIAHEEGEEGDGGRVVLVGGEGPGSSEDEGEGAAGDPRQEAHGTGDVRVHQLLHLVPLEQPPCALRRRHEPPPVRRYLQTFPVPISIEEANVGKRGHSQEIEEECS